MKLKSIKTKILICSLLASLVFSYSSSPSMKAENTIKEFENTQVELLSKQSELEASLQNLKNDNSKRDEYTKALDNLVDTVQRQIDTECEKLLLIESESVKKEIAIKETQEDIEKKFEAFRQRMKAIVISGGTDLAYMKAILNVSNTQELFDTASAVEVIGKHDQKLINDLKDELKKVQNEKIELEQKKVESSEAQSKFEVKKSELQKLQDENEQILKESRAKKEREQAISLALAPLNQKNTQISVSVGKGGFYCWPVPASSNISSPYGPRWGGFHSGIDISASEGTPIVAAADGVVTFAAYDNSGYGNHIRISHASGHSTLYGHCSALNVSAGQHVSSGQVIGFVGHTGQADGSHLHFETAQNGSRYNPTSEF